MLYLISFLKVGMNKGIKKIRDTKTKIKYPPKSLGQGDETKFIVWEWGVTC